MGFSKVEQDVRTILEDNTAARCDDMTLYADYCYSKVKDMNYGKEWLQVIFSNRRFRIIHGIAPFETVSRVRRKIQAHDPDLRADEDTRREKKEMEKKYKDYAKSKVIS